ncbi:MAG TPA: hypothetical protein VKZ49_07985 [Polyangiaceae bacterium]|nr:hypothetical protein [Polyangiaceae bacterium]
MTSDQRHLLHIYLHDHLGAAAAGAELARRAAAVEANTEIGPALRKLASDIQHDRKQLRAAMVALGAKPRAPLHEGLGWLAEKLGRLKLNGRIVSRSPLSRLMEIEGLHAGVMAKRGVWQTLQELRQNEPRLAECDVEGMLARADDQARRLRELHHYAARTAFGVQSATSAGAKRYRAEAVQASRP